MLTQRIKVAMDRRIVPPTVFMVQNDTGRVLVCELSDYTADGTETATLSCKRPNESYYDYSGTVDATTNTVTVALDQTGGALTRVGTVEAMLKVSKSGERVTTFPINIVVMDDLSGESEEDEPGGGGTSDYNALSNKPSINGVILQGNKTSSELGITAARLGAIPAPASPTSGAFLVWNGSAWVAASLPVYNGGVS